MAHKKPRIAVVNYGMGNLSSVRFACEAAGLEAVVTSAAADLDCADGIILPGVGAFGEAMEALHALDLVAPLRDLGLSPKPLIGICLGMQLLMTESDEFGHHAGLDIVEGSVVRLKAGLESATAAKVPHVGWSRIWRAGCTGGSEAAGETCKDPWAGSPLAGLADGAFMYFVHSFQVKPVQDSVHLCTSRHGDIDFCSGLQRGHVVGFQFHPERSGSDGLQVYRNLAGWLRREKASMEETDACTSTAIAG